jgi:hypothetical protein
MAEQAPIIEQGGHMPSFNNSPHPMAVVTSAVNIVKGIASALLHLSGQKSNQIKKTINKRKAS